MFVCCGVGLCVCVFVCLCVSVFVFLMARDSALHVLRAHW